MKKSVSKKTKTEENIAEDRLLNVQYYFPSIIYTIERPDFLDTVNQVSNESLKLARKTQKLDKIYPVIMSGNYYDDPRVSSFAEFVGGTAWNILNEQGYNMQDLAVSFTEMWTQEHHKPSSMEQHVHGYGSQIVGMYFLEVPEGSSRLVFHDPRPGKVQIDLPEQDISQVTSASRMVNIEPKPGLMVFSNSWLAHSFTRHTASSPIKFVHFNLTVQHNVQLCPMSEAEVI